MMAFRSGAYAALVATFVAGTATLGVAATAGYDGVYRGTATLERGDASVCGKESYPMTVSLVNGQFSIVWDPNHHVGVNLQVQNDGSFNGTQQYTVGSSRGTTAQLRASGHVAGNQLDAHVESQYCSRNYRLNKG